MKAKKIWVAINPFEETGTITRLSEPEENGEWFESADGTQSEYVTYRELAVLELEDWIL